MNVRNTVLPSPNSDLLALIPLTAEQKMKCITALKNTDRQALSSALLSAALPPTLCEFPGTLKDLLGILQKAYRVHANNPDVTAGLMSTIQDYMTSEGFSQFESLLNGDINESIWNSDLLYYLTNRLNIQIDYAPVVQATIKDGKVLWRILVNNAVVYDRPLIKGWDVSFTSENSWLISWELFREFKASGKRYSPVKITKEIFAATLAPQNQPAANLIWDQLKNAGILNAKNRLSQGWQTLSNVNIQLPFIESMKFKTVNEKKSAKTQWYNQIRNALHTIANNPAFSEKIAVIPHATLFRAERSPKLWKGTGRITNADGDTEAYCTKRWDVGTYKELYSHRNSELEKEYYGNSILHYDHNPSTSSLKNTETPITRAYALELRAIEDQLTEYKNRSNPKIPRDTRNLEKQLTAEDVENNIKIEELTAKRDLLSKSQLIEIKEFAYCIAMPKALHKQSDTTMESKSEQSKREGNPFFLDVSAHLTRLKSHPGDFSIKSHDDYLKALGAFRYLYRTQCKPPEPAITGQPQIGRFSHSFFQILEDRKKLDDLFISEMKEFMSRREGTALNK